MYSVKQIQREQSQLSRIEKEIQAMLEKVNETLNVLKVEELQLRASAVAPLDIKPHALQSHNTETAREIANTLSTLPYQQQQHIESDVKEINEQEINLDLFVRPYDEEMDEIEST